MSNVTNFNFKNNQVRVITINGEPWFVVQDVLLALKSNTTVTAVKATVQEGLGDEFVNNIPILDDLNREQDTTIISEAGLTFWVSRGRTELAKKMNRWIHTEVLPSIRKTGSYSVNNTQPTLDAPETAVKAAKAVDNIQKTLANSQPRLAQFLIEVAINDAIKYLNKSNNSLENTKESSIVSKESDLELMTCEAWASENNFPVTKKNRSSLGKFVANIYREETQGEPLFQKQECGGALREIKVYPCEFLERVIPKYFS